MFHNFSFAASLNFLVWSGLCFNWLSAVRRLLVDNRMWQHILNLRAFQWWLETRSLIVNHPALYYYTVNCTGYISDLYSINHFCKMALLSLYEEKWQSNKASLIEIMEIACSQLLICNHLFSFSQSSGGVPYPTLTNSELYRLLGTGYRMERPDMCSDDVYVSWLEWS